MVEFIRETDDNDTERTFGNKVERGHDRKFPAADFLQPPAEPQQESRDFGSE